MPERTRTRATKVKSLAKAPATFEELRALLIEISRGESNVVLGAKARNAFGQILDLQGSPELLSITKLADKIGTNPSTITRLARNLGYENFGGFQKALFAAPATRPGAFYLDRAQDVLGRGNQPVRQRAARLCHENQANIDRFVETFDTDAFENAVDLITDARRVAVFGIRQFHSLASFLVYTLQMVRSDVFLLGSNSLGTAEALAGMRHGDVCIITSVSPYSSEVLQVARTAAEEGITIVAITDRASSPLVQYAKVAIFAPNDSSFFSNSMLSYFAVAECLVNAIVSAEPRAARQALRERQRLIDNMKIEQIL